jgi:RNA polymerase sigma factor (sigma-70 family)
MRPIRDRNLAELLMQLRFTPEGKRVRQLEATEQLIALVDETKDYPFEFVHFRITGFHPSDALEPYTIRGKDLLDDLRVFVTRLSGIAAPHAIDQGERVYTVEDLARTLDVSTKTIHRWRRQGLVVRRFVFHDGTKRLGVLQSSVDRFIEGKGDRVAKARQFARLTEPQRRQIVELARSLAGQGSFSRHQVIGQVAAQTGRARETIRYTLLKFEKMHPGQPLTDRPTGVISIHDAHQLYDLYRQGTPVRALMDQFRRSRSSVYRIINQRRASALLSRKIQFVASDEFLDERAREAILSEAVDLPVVEGPRTLSSPEVLGEHLMPEYLQVLKDAPALNTTTERNLFRKYNCLKFLAHELRSHINLSSPPSDTLSRIEAYLVEADAIERTIVGANLRLVVGIASKHSASGPHFAELVSKGNYALITAVQEFDYTKGVRFGKQAALGIAKEYAKTSGRSTELSREKAASIATIQRQLRQTADIAAIERTRQSLTEVIHRELDQREQYVILHHFGLIGSGIKRQTKTLQQIGEELDLTKERVRQIELVALSKLRQCLSPEQFELLTG